MKSLHGGSLFLLLHAVSQWTIQSAHSSNSMLHWLSTNLTHMTQFTLTSLPNTPLYLSCKLLAYISSDENTEHNSIGLN